MFYFFKQILGFKYKVWVFYKFYKNLIEPDFYNVWEIEYLKGGKYRLKTFNRLFTEKAGEHEDTKETMTGTWKIREDGVIILDEGKRGEDDDEIVEAWFKPIAKAKEKFSYLTVFPSDEDPLATVVYEFRGKVPAVLLDLAPVISSPFKKK